MTHDSSGRDGGFLIGLLAGAAVGGSLALLFAPRDGAGMRQGLARGARRWANPAGMPAADPWSTARHGDGSPWPEDRGASPSEVLRAAAAEATYTPSQENASTAEGPRATSPASPANRS